MQQAIDKNLAIPALNQTSAINQAAGALCRAAAQWKTACCTVLSHLFTPDQRMLDFHEWMSL